MLDFGSWTKLALVLLPLGGAVSGSYFVGSNLLKGRDSPSLLEETSSKNREKDRPKVEDLQETKSPKSENDESPLKGENSLDGAASKLEAQDLDESSKVDLSKDQISQELPKKGENDSTSKEALNPEALESGENTNPSSETSDSNAQQGNLEEVKEKSVTMSETSTENISRDTQDLVESVQNQTQQDVRNFNFGDDEVFAEYILDAISSGGKEKACSKVEKGQTKYLSSEECRKMLSENSEEINKTTNSKIWIKAQNEKSVNKVLEGFFSYSSWTKEKLKDRWEERDNFGNDLVCTSKVTSSSQIIVNCSLREETSNIVS